MPDLWLPGAVKDPQPGGVRLNKALPARGTWHITADRLDPVTMAQPARANVWNYLRNVGYCPHLLWDPFDGYLVQAYPADVGARALSRWNEDGAVNLQVEIYFSPGVIRGGTQYLSVDQTPCTGLEEIVDWMESWGVPPVWPLGSPTWESTQDADVWNARAGHYGHIQVPGENHRDPGPMPGLRAAVTEAAAGLLIPELGGLSA
ncbi:hypothetical protein FJV46_10750 [Arthrobacter agilis]|uniref:hypothetical protein n=1 Tax=Arthrobacter agilis TaxID=37921 RepID=UPI000B363BCE|nr:hypothetical protein [Arthrobacter agilis]OUM44145.1 hypothetical protein B8W74_04535 [Arthrobacter agilis]PPB46521.1 hypothetical protein CI784_06830 [Arthrobacter agilis]TPV23823.1 hypothetical protein FJV46_10750 [Arthrobacter agilis]VDR32558.1 Uncharacterised protein [Arthrobacter agilis]